MSLLRKSSDYDEGWDHEKHNKAINLTALRCVSVGKLWQRYVCKGDRDEKNISNNFHNYFVAFYFAIKHGYFCKKQCEYVSKK